MCDTVCVCVCVCAGRWVMGVGMVGAPSTNQTSTKHSTYLVTNQPTKKCFSNDEYSCKCILVLAADNPPTHQGTIYQLKSCVEDEGNIAWSVLGCSYLPE